MSRKSFAAKHLATVQWFDDDSQFEYSFGRVCDLRSPPFPLHFRNVAEIERLVLSILAPWSSLDA